MHEKQKDYQCDICKKSFGHKFQVQRHIDTVHLKKKEHKCEYCDKAFGQKSHLYEHVKNRSCKKSKYVKKQVKNPILPKPNDEPQFENKSSKRAKMNIRERPKKQNDSNNENLLLLARNQRFNEDSIDEANELSLKLEEVKEFFKKQNEQKLKNMNL